MRGLRLLLVILLLLLLASVIDAIAEGVDARGGLIGTALCVLALVIFRGILIQ